ncbi:probable LRR receptor-like serine/threonine-protein kinase At1g07650 isoform X2 [Ziziphus jujuba]|uniref:non-specific serine/threonine protein kinase n=1 Tax=Ziziphus jujuba TaxID=326968 RepID=A0A6P6FM28_ZIZJJ|nr:probable LRR receptor-like serine/threonine-protein kinase At1g07650 isoform X2 [Ziziphus jujuba]
MKRKERTYNAYTIFLLGRTNCNQTKRGGSKVKKCMANFGLMMMFRSHLVFLVLSLVAKAQAANGTLPHDEVEALREIGEQLNKKDWNFSDPCSNIPTMATPHTDEYNNTVVCNCSFPANQCHIQSIFLMGQDLDGVLPPSLAKLTFLKDVNLGQNHLSGSIPHEWASTKLEILVISVNNLSGPIPAYLGNITTLRELALESNLFSGTIPPEFGKLVNLETLFLSANNLTGELPNTLRNLTKLLVLISSNNFTGRIPDFFQSWKSLEKLEMQASGFEGPIPSSLSILNNLTELRISDLNGESSDFPDLENMKDMQILMLRSCNIKGSFPEYISTMRSLRNLDLSFNRLEGTIQNFADLVQLDTIYLTSNFLTGAIPDWLKSRDSRYQIDLSYNNFSEISVPPTCRETFNLYRSFSRQNNLILSKCLNSCSKEHYSLHINCGGQQTTIGSITYEGDEDTGGAAKFFHNNTANWGFSSTGDFLDRRSTQDDYIAKNMSILRMNNSKLYTTARVSPLSLTYYAQCLVNGNYTVTLHFAEIVLRDNISYFGVGRRMFDVYIQGKLELKDFDIEKEASGVDKEEIVVRKTVVNSNTLEIRFHWSGKGTTNVPKRGTYGSLISAISIESDSKPPNESKKTMYIVIGGALVLCLIFITIGSLWWKSFFIGKTSREEVLRGIDLRTGFFTFKQIKAATNNFDVGNKLGEGGFGSVYKGLLLDGTSIAVKQLSSKSKQGNREFVNEIGMISALEHPNLVKLYGCCIEGKQLILVYEYMENNSLAHSLFGPEEGKLELDWSTRQKICLGIAKGLAFLHEESTLKIVHRDIKASNILLDRDLNPKISDFGLAKLDEEENTHISTRVAGTIGYMAPEYALWGYLTDKADVYSFGVVALELVAGIKNTKFHPQENYVCLLDWALVSNQKGKLMELVDPKLGSQFNKKEATRMIKVAMLCTNPSPALRPSMSAVVSMLEGRTTVHELIMGPNIHDLPLTIGALGDQFDPIENQSESEVRNHSWDGTCVGSSSISVRDP